MDTNPVRVGLVGCGHIGRFHSRNIHRVARLGVLPVACVAVADRVPGRAEAFAEITGARVAADASELLREFELDALYICTETAEHPALVDEAVARRLAVFCEKPLARTLSEVEAMAGAVTKAGVTNQVGLILRTSPVYTVLAGMMTDPSLGALLTAHLRDDQFFPIRGHYNSIWRGDFARAGGGTLIEHSIHDVDLFRWLFGEIRSVRCHTRHVSGHRGVEDVALATFEHDGGLRTTLSSVWHSVDSRPSSRRLEVFFERGWFATDHDFIGPLQYQLGDDPRVELSADEVFERYCEIQELERPMADLARAGIYADYRFLAAVAESRPAFPDFNTALAAHRVVDACYRSAADGLDVAILP